MNMKKVVGDLLFFAIILLLLSRFLTIFTGMAYPLSVVSSSSMTPVLNKGDIVPWIPCSVEDVREGDIVVYKSVYGNLIIHRVVETRNGKFITKGDANNYTDQQGPHVPEALVGKNNLLGKAIMVGDKALKIPLLGYFWIFTRDVVGKMASPITWGRPQSAAHYIIFIPFIFSVSLFLLLLTFWMSNGKNTQERLREMIFGAEKLSMKKTFMYIMAMFLPFLLLTSFFSYDHISLEGNGEKLAGGIPVFNPSVLPVKGIVFVEGNKNLTVERKIFSIESGESIKIGFDGNKKEGEIYLYSSPYWRILPDSIIKIFYESNPRLCVFLSAMISALLMALITLFLLIIISFMVDKIILINAHLSFLFLFVTPAFHPFYKITHHVKNKINIMRNDIKNMMIWVERVNKKTIFAPLATLFFIPLLFDGIGNLILTAILSSIAVSFFAYIIGCRFKNEMALASLISSSLIVIIFVSRMASFATDGIPFIIIEYASISIIIMMLLFFIQFPIMLMISSFLHYIRELVNPCALTEVCDL